MDTGNVLLGGSLAVAGVVWLVRLEGRINLGDERYSSLKGDIHEIKEDVKALLHRQFERRGTDAK
jgi:hypothetical protein